MFVAMPVFGVSFSQIGEILSSPNPESLPMIKFLQIVQTVFGFLLPAVLCAWLYSHDTIDFIKADRKPRWGSLFLAIITLIVAIPLLNGMTWINSHFALPESLHFIEEKMRGMEDQADKLTEMFLTGGTIRGFIFNLLMIAVLPALSEEILFRGVAQRLLTDVSRNVHAGIWLAAFLFSFVHFQFYGFLPRLLLGAYLGYLFYWSGSIWLPIVAHFINNGFAVVYYHFATQPMNSTVMDQLGVASRYKYWLFISLAGTSLLIYLTYKREKQVIKSVH
jgi:membrane protease YdiL (CAAX protease family)